MVVDDDVEAGARVVVDDPEEAVEDVGRHADVALPARRHQRCARLGQRLGVRVDAFLSCFCFVLFCCCVWVVFVCVGSLASVRIALAFVVCASSAAATPPFPHKTQHTKHNTHKQHKHPVA